MDPIRPENVGARVSLRYRRDDGGLADVVGELLAVDVDHLRLVRSDGRVETLPLERVLAARSVAPSRRDVLALEELAGRLWPAAEEEWLGRWWLRAGGGGSWRAEAARLLGEPDREPTAALAALTAWYRERQVAPRLRMVAGYRFEPVAAAAGWRRVEESLVLFAPIARIRSAIARRGAPAVAVSVEASPSERWLALYRRLPTAVLSAPSVVAFASIGDAEVLAIGRGAVEGAWAELAVIEVAEHARRRGLARALIDALLEWAQERGARRVYLEVGVDNVAARRLYEMLGFDLHHEVGWWALLG
ncbi:MAG: GNAT family N-acetyltransferase [Acidothermus sp.]|nr:GNAT family N-acetyltransferase [Acidothermus sp.]